MPTVTDADWESCRALLSGFAVVREDDIATLESVETSLCYRIAADRQQREAELRKWIEEAASELAEAESLYRSIQMGISAHKLARLLERKP